MGYVVTGLMASGVNVSLAIWEKTVKLILTIVKVILVENVAGKIALPSINHKGMDIIYWL